MAVLTLRNTKGSPLTNTELDNNFISLNTDKFELGGTYTSGIANSIPYLNASKILSTSSNLTYDGTNLFIANNTGIHAGNYSSYALPLSGGTLTGNRNIEFNTTSGGVFIRGDSGGWATGLYFRGSDNATKAAFGGLGSGSIFTYLWAGPEYNNTWMTWTSSAVNSQVALQQGGNQVLHAGNYNSYALPLSGGTVTGTLSLGGTLKRTAAGTGYLDGAYNTGAETVSTSGAIYSIGGGYAPGTTTLGSMYGIGYGYSGTAMGNPGSTPNGRWGFYVASNGVARVFLDSDNGQGWFSGALYSSGGNLVLNANNYSSYALPLSGGTLTGGLTAPNFNDSYGAFNINLGSGGYEGRGLVAGYSGGWYGGIGYNVRHTASSGVLIAPSADTSSYLGFNSGGFSFYGAGTGAVGRTLSFTTLATLSAAGTFNAVNLTANNYQVLHANNYNSYAPTLTGTGASGTWGISITGNASTVSSISSGQVTGALGYTPYSSANPSGFTSNTGTVTSVSGTGSVAGLSLGGSVTTSGSLTLSGTLSASIDNITDEHRLFNNMGDSHVTRSSFDAASPSYNFGWRFIQGSMNGPDVNSASQYYSLYVGLGNDYGATGAGSYGMQLAIPRNVTTPYLAVRYNENNSLAGWQKISAGYADSAGAVAWTNVSGRPTAVSAFTNDSGYITAGANITGMSHFVRFLDNRAVNDQPQGKAGYVLSADFKDNAAAGSPPVTASGLYSHILTTAGWDTNGGSGGWPAQLSIGDGIAVRQATSSTAWGPWRTVLHSNNFSSYALPLSGGTVSGLVNINNLLTQAAVSNNVNGLRNINPGGGTSVTSSSVVNGAIRITLPQNVAPMIRFTVRVYTYDNLSFDIYCGGHTSGGAWYNTFAYMTTQNRSALNVRFTYGGGNVYVYIGDLGSSWSYPQVFITDVQVGYVNYEYDRWDDGWNIAYDASSYNTISATHAVYPPSSSVNNSQSYASIYYDSGDTNYYIDPASTSDSALKIRGGALFGPNTSYGASLYIGSNGRVGTSATVAVTNGNLHIDSQNGYQTYINWYSNENIYTSGNLGVGSGSANHRLHVHGTGLATADFRSPIFYDSDNTGYYVDPASTSNVNVMQAYQYQGNGNVGGTGNASWHPSGIYSAGFNWLYGGINAGGGSVTNMVDARANLFYDYNDTAFYIDPNSTGTAGNFAGTINATDFNSTSDIRYKKDLSVIDDALNKVLSINGYTFTLKETNQRSAGVIAQEVEKVLPEVVHGDETKKTVSYGNMVGLLIEAIKEQQRQIEKLKKLLEK